MKWGVLETEAFRKFGRDFMRERLTEGIGLYGRRNEDGSYAEIDDNGVVTVRNKDGGMLMQMCREDWEALRGCSKEKT